MGGMAFEVVQQIRNTTTYYLLVIIFRSFIILKLGLKLSILAVFHEQSTISFFYQFELS